MHLLRSVSKLCFQVLHLIVVCVCLCVWLCVGGRGRFGKRPDFSEDSYFGSLLILIPWSTFNIFSNFFDTVSGQSVFSDIKWQGAMSAAGWGMSITFNNLPTIKRIWPVLLLVIWNMVELISIEWSRQILVLTWLSSALTKFLETLWKANKKIRPVDRAAFSLLAKSNPHKFMLRLNLSVL